MRIQIKRSKRYLAGLLVIVVLLGMVPLNTVLVFAEEGESQTNLMTTNETTGVLKISKEVVGSGLPDKNTQYEFTVTKDGAVASGQYTIDGGEAKAIPASGIIRLKAKQTATLTVPTGKYTITESEPSERYYLGTKYAVNGTVAKGLSTTVLVEAKELDTGGGWMTDDNGNVKQDDEGYFVYDITADQIDNNNNIKIDCNPLAEYMEYMMRRNQNVSTSKFKVKFVNQTGTPIKYTDYSFDTVNWIPVGSTFAPNSTNPTMKDTTTGAGSYSAGYGWGQVWKPVSDMVTGTKLCDTTLGTTGFDSNNVRIVIAPLRTINPAIISYFISNPGEGVLTNNKLTSSTSRKAGYITLKQMNALPELIKKEFTFKDYKGDSLTLPADSNRTYADFICEFYRVSSLDELSTAQKYNVLGTGVAGSPVYDSSYNGQSAITTYLKNSSGKFENWCIPYADLNDGTLNYFKNWGFSGNRIAEGIKLSSGGQIADAETAETYAYQNNYYLLESDPEVAKMGYEFLYERCIRLTFDNDKRSLSKAADDSASPADDVCGVKDYIDKTDAAKAHILDVMNGGTSVENGDSIVLNSVEGFIEVPNAWNRFRYYDFGFSFVFKADNQPGEADGEALVSFTNYYGEIPDIIHEDGPDTGDKTKLGLWITFAVLSLLALVGIACRKRFFCSGRQENYR